MLALWRVVVPAFGLINTKTDLKQNCNEFF